MANLTRGYLPLFKIFMRDLGHLMNFIQAVSINLVRVLYFCLLTTTFFLFSFASHYQTLFYVHFVVFLVVLHLGEPKMFCCSCSAIKC